MLLLLHKRNHNNKPQTMKKLIGLLLASVLVFNIPAVGQGAKSPFLYEKENTTIKFGGHVRVNTFADFGGLVANNDFRNAIINVPDSWDNKSRFNIDPSHTRLSVKAVQKTENAGDIEFYIETDFRGTGNVIRLRQAYFAFKGFVLGQTWSFMNDLASQAPTVDIQAANSRTFYRTPLLGYKVDLDKNISIGISIELPSVKMTTQPGIKQVDQTFPDIPAFVQFKGESGHIKLTGVVRPMDYGVIGTEKIETEVGLGTQLSGSINATKYITLYSQAIYGKGIAKYINDLSLLNVDLVPGKNVTTQQAVNMYGISVGAKGTLSKNTYCAATVSNAGFVNKDDYYSAKEYFTGSYISASLFWTGIKNMTIAGEYIYGTRKNMNNLKGNANRVQLLFMYKW